VTSPWTAIGLESMMLRKRLTRTPVSFTGTIAYSPGTQPGMRSGYTGRALVKR
jgi:hypothetical protein